MPSSAGPVLVVEDDDAVRNALQFALEMEGLEVRTYAGGFQLLAEPSLPAQGCLVVDYYMPVMTGIALVEYLRRRHVNLPAILITAKATEEMRRNAARAGIRQVLEKPLEDSSLIDSVRDALLEHG